jgi:hypothetical protein
VSITLRKEQKRKRLSAKKEVCVVGVTGRRRSGKSTVAWALTKNLGFIDVMFAESLKRTLSELFGWPMENWERDEWKDRPQRELYGKSPRQIAQSFGTEWGRNMISESFWVDRAWELARRKAEVTGRHIVFPDVRFDNEAQLVRDAGGVLIEVIREGQTVGDADAHSSEAGVSPELIDHTITAKKGQVALLRESALKIVAKHIDERTRLT